SYFNIVIYMEQYVGLVFGLILAATFVGTPSRKNEIKNILPWYDCILSVLSLGVGMYVAIFYPKILLFFGYVTPDRVLFGILAILLVLEALRRLTGWVLVVVVSLFIGYSFIASSMPGPLNGTTTSI